MAPDEMTGWVDERLAEHAMARRGEVELYRERTWSRVYRVPTDAGQVWLKAPPPQTVAEIELYPVLERAAPDAVLASVGIDVERGWLLLPDGGVSAGERFAGDELVAVMTHAVRQYAQLQIALAPHVEDVLRAGVPDMRPDSMPERFAEALAGAEDYVHAAGTDAERDGYERLRTMHDEVAAWCAELATSSVAPSVDHNDLHAWNVLGTGDAHAFTARFYDWGDCVVAHPFSSLLVVLDSLPATAADRLRDTYLERFGDPAQLRRECDLAIKVGQIARALIWQRALGDAGHDHEHSNTRVESLLELMD